MATPSPFSPRGLTRFGVNVRLADFTDPEGLARELATGDKVKLVYFETPANPNLRLIDIARISSLAKFSLGRMAYHRSPARGYPSDKFFLLPPRYNICMIGRLAPRQRNF
jgi:hypothetical protein